MPDIYTALLTGDADSVSDFEFIIKSYSGIHYSGAISYMSFQLPKVNGYTEAMAARPNGEFSLQQNGIDLFVGVISWLNFYVGSVNKTISVSADYLKTETGPAASSLPVTNIHYEYDGKRVFTIEGYHTFKATDSLLYDSETIEIDKVSIVLGENRKYMTLREL